MNCHLGQPRAQHWTRSSLPKFSSRTLVRTNRLKNFKSSQATQESQQSQPQTTESPSSADSTAQEQAPQPAAAGPLWEVPWDAWEFIQLGALLLVANFTIPYAGSTFASLASNSNWAEMGPSQKEVYFVAFQLVQLVTTATLLSWGFTTYRPLKGQWFKTHAGIYAGSQAVGAAVVAVAADLLYTCFAHGTSDGIGEWQALFVMEPPLTTGIVALTVGAVLLAPLNEELIFRGYILPSLSKWFSPTASVAITALLFAAIHPPSTFVEEAIIGACFGGSLLLANGNLFVPLVAHALYNATVLALQATQSTM